MDVIVAGVGNLLRGDDGFGVLVAQYLEQDEPPPGVRVLDIGIGGIHLVQELLRPVDVLIVVDAVELERPPGTVLVIRPAITDVTVMPLAQRHDELADMHYATPERAFMLAHGLGVLPPVTWLVGCQPGAESDRPGEDLSPEVRAAIGSAAAEVRRLVTEAGVSWTAG
ncbi:hydrogenase maturation protease [Pseudonocardia kunmingensis]|uniref:Hydrogenase maturation protease n=1 Tax=Pseudonocardia kunmingensis TaxID=630975 RepID=A0A543DP72_9PSEU|nr:hydrogenase maturation protease [Pseudonocardia kunmingensis]TQM11095.1 hydrogenase maturation protease [Pseudonocardia kunmingensis]